MQEGLRTAVALQQAIIANASSAYVRKRRRMPCSRSFPEKGSTRRIASLKKQNKANGISLEDNVQELDVQQKALDNMKAQLNTRAEFCRQQAESDDSEHKERVEQLETLEALRVVSARHVQEESLALQRQARAAEEARAAGMAEAKKRVRAAPLRARAVPRLTGCAAGGRQGASCQGASRCPGADRGRRGRRPRSERVLGAAAR
jgi:hypothetical protein